MLVRAQRVVHVVVGVVDRAVLSALLASPERLSACDNKNKARSSVARIVTAYDEEAARKRERRE